MFDCLAFGLRADVNQWERSIHRTQGRGTEVRVVLDYLPPLGRFGAIVARMLGKDPKRQIQEDLRHFKTTDGNREIATSQGPRGECQAAGRPPGGMYEGASLVREEKSVLRMSPTLESSIRREHHSGDHDLHLRFGFFTSTTASCPIETGDILGHEFMGIVEEVGPASRTSSPATAWLCIHDRVRQLLLLQAQLWSACDNSNPTRWMAEKMMGYSPRSVRYSHLTGRLPGGQAQFVRCFRGRGTF